METVSPLRKLFGKSPFKALQQHARKVGECAEQLPVLVDALVAGQNEQAQDAIALMRTTEGEAETLKNTLFSHLPKSLFMPVDRRDLLEILNFNNRVADECLLVAEHMMVPVAPLPAALADGFCTATRQCVAVVQQTVCVMDEMDEMVETGFGGREATLVSGMLDEVGAARKRADNAIQNLFRALFTQGEALSPIAVVFWSRILDELTEVTRTAGRASNRVRLLLAH